MGKRKIKGGHISPDTSDIESSSDSDEEDMPVIQIPSQFQVALQPQSPPPSRVTPQISPRDPDDDDTIGPETDYDNDDVYSDSSESDDEDDYSGGKKIKRDRKKYKKYKKYSKKRSKKFKKSIKIRKNTKKFKKSNKRRKSIKRRKNKK